VITRPRHQNHSLRRWILVDYKFYEKLDEEIVGLDGWSYMNP